MHQTTPSRLACALVLGLCVPAAPLALHAAELEPGVPFVQVSGLARGEAAFDRALVPFTLRSEMASAEEVSRDLAEKSRQLVDALSQIGLAEPNVRLNGPLLSIIYTTTTEEEGGKRIERRVPGGVRGDVSFQVRVTDFKKIPKIITVATAAGGLVATPMFEVANLDEERARLGVEAVKSALSRARRLVEAAGGKAGRVISITEERGGRVPLDQPLARALSASEPAPELPVMPGRALLEQGVTLRLEILQP